MILTVFHFQAQQANSFIRPCGSYIVLSRWSLTYAIRVTLKTSTQRDGSRATTPSSSAPCVHSQSVDCWVKSHDRRGPLTRSLQRMKTAFDSIIGQDARKTLTSKSVKHVHCDRHTKMIKSYIIAYNLPVKFVHIYSSCSFSAVS